MESEGKNFAVSLTTALNEADTVTIGKVDFQRLIGGVFGLFEDERELPLGCRTETCPDAEVAVN